jgi:hypothetical protein
LAKRTIELATCGRAYATSCQHEFACIRCPMLRPDPAQQQRLEDIIASLGERLSEAHERGWLGEVEGLQISLAAAEQKLLQMRRTAINLGSQRFPQKRRGERRDHMTLLPRRAVTVCNVGWALAAARRRPDLADDSVGNGQGSLP